MTNIISAMHETQKLLAGSFISFGWKLYQFGLVASDEGVSIYIKVFVGVRGTKEISHTFTIAEFDQQGGPDLEGAVAGLVKSMVDEYHLEGEEQS